MKGFCDINWLYYHHYHDNPELRRIVTIHSEQVAKKALEICRRKNLPLNHHDVYLAAMLHDIGVVKCNAPSIHARGSLPYICHGVEGKKILEKAGLYKYAKVCERHTGAGLSVEDIQNRRLPLPPHDMIPHSLLEKLICYSDKFFSKSKDLKKEKSLEEVIEQMKKFGDSSYQRFLELHEIFK